MNVKYLVASTEGVIVKSGAVTLESAAQQALGDQVVLLADASVGLIRDDALIVDFASLTLALNPAYLGADTSSIEYVGLAVRALPPG